MIVVEILAAVAVAGKLIEQGVMIFWTVHFDEKHRTSAGKQFRGSLNDCNFGAFDVAFQEIGWRMRGGVLVERNGFDVD